MGRDKLKAFFERQESARQGVTDQARSLLASGKLDEAERLVQASDSSIQGGVLIARLYQERLEALVAAGAAKHERATVEAVYHRALDWAQRCYPEPHTEIEADNYRAGRAEDRARLVGILGYEPPSPAR